LLAALDFSRGAMNANLYESEITAIRDHSRRGGSAANPR
jgi:hypothetical protein